MLQVSDTYRATMASTIRPQAHHMVKLRVFNVTASSNAVFSSNDSCFFSMLSSLSVESTAPQNTYATLELGRFLLDGTQNLPPDSANYEDYGWTSNSVSGANGTFEFIPTLSVTFDKEYDIAGLTLEFDSFTGEYASAITVRSYHTDDTLISTINASPSETIFTIEQKFMGAAKITVEILSTSKPFRRARIRQFLLGVIMRHNNTSMSSSGFIEDVDPLARKLPEESCEFTLVDYERIYDPDNPSGLWEYVDILAPVGLTYGRTLIDGNIEWLPEMMYQLDGKPEKDGINIKFKAHRKLYTLTDTYTSDVVTNTKSLKSLAIEVLSDCLGDDSSQWSIDDCLNDIVTSAPMPELPHRECLQLIANAGMCRLFTDNNGVINLISGYMPNVSSGVSYSSINAPLKKPIMAKNSPLKSVCVQKYQYTASGSSSEQYKYSVESNGEVDYIDNPLVTSLDHCEKIAAYHAEYIKMRSTYTLLVRGNPEIEAGDIVDFSTDYENSAHGLVLKQSIELNNGTSGELIVKRITNRRGDYQHTGEMYCGEMGVM